MALRQILTEPNEILRKKSLPVEAVNKDLQKLMDDMLETMYAAPGIGLAAIQIGVPKRIIVMDIGFRDKSDDINNYKEEGKKNPMYFVNPEIINKSKNNSKYEEGCLSVPGQFAEIERSRKCEVELLVQKYKIRFFSPAAPEKGQISYFFTTSSVWF